MPRHSLCQSLEAEENPTSGILSVYHYLSNNLRMERYSLGKSLEELLKLPRI